MPNESDHPPVGSGLPQPSDFTILMRKVFWGGAVAIGVGLFMLLGWCLDAERDPVMLVVYGVLLVVAVLVIRYGVPFRHGENQGSAQGGHHLFRLDIPAGGLWPPVNP